MYFVHVYLSQNGHSRYLGPFKKEEEANKIAKKFGSIKDSDGYLITDAYIECFDKEEDLIKELRDYHKCQI